MYVIIDPKACVKDKLLIEGVGDLPILKSGTG